LGGERTNTGGGKITENEFAAQRIRKAKIKQKKCLEMERTYCSGGSDDPQATLPKKLSKRRVPAKGPLSKEGCGAEGGGAARESNEF